MRVIGPVQLDAATAATLLTVDRIELPKAVWSKHTRANARPGDLFWVREPFVLFTDKRSGINTEAVFGTLTTIKRPAWVGVRGQPNVADYGVRVCSAEQLRQSDSRHALEVMSRDAAGVITCRVHRENVSVLYRRVAA